MHHSNESPCRAKKATSPCLEWVPWTRPWRVPGSTITTHHTITSSTFTKALQHGASVSSVIAAVPLCFCSLRSTWYGSLQVLVFKQSDTVPERQVKLDTSAWHGQRDRAFNQSLTLFEVADLWDRTQSSNVLTPLPCRQPKSHLCKTEQIYIYNISPTLSHEGPDINLKKIPALQGGSKNQYSIYIYIEP